MKQLLDKKTVSALWLERREILRDTKAAARLLGDDARESIGLHHSIACGIIDAASDDAGRHTRHLIRAAAFHLLTLKRLAFETPLALRTTRKGRAAINEKFTSADPMAVLRAMAFSTPVGRVKIRKGLPDGDGNSKPSSSSK